MLVNMSFLTGKDILPEKDLQGKTATRKRFEYSPLGKETVSRIKYVFQV